MLPNVKLQNQTQFQTVSISLVESKIVINNNKFGRLKLFFKTVQKNLKCAVQNLSFALCGVFCSSFAGFIYFFRQDVESRLIMCPVEIFTFYCLNNSNKKR